MIRRYGTGLRALLMLTDIAVTAALVLSLSWLIFGANPPWQAVLPDPGLGLVLYVCTWVTILWAHGLYRLRARWSLASDARAIFQATAVLALAVFAFLFVAQLAAVSRLYLFALLILQFAVTVAERAALRWYFGQIRRQGGNLRHIVVLGTGPVAQDFARKLEEHPELGLRIEGFLGERPRHLPARWRYLGSLEDTADVVHERVVDELAICLSAEEWPVVEEVVKLCETEGKIARIPVPIPALTIARSHVDDLEGTPVLSILTGPGTALSLALKRVIDVTTATAGLLVLAPLFISIAVATLVTDGRPIFFRQERVGLHGRRFRVLKFRSMVRDAEALLEDLAEHNEIKGHAFKVTGDPRITRVGLFLRRSSLDELPQLWNVLRGEMSLVGPRPPLPSEVADYDLWHRRRLSMKPGITGLWQIEGRRESEFDHWVRKDLEYIDRWSPLLDIEILLRTIPAVLRAEGR